jgi:hypothetical protein
MKVVQFGGALGNSIFPFFLFHFLKKHSNDEVYMFDQYGSDYMGGVNYLLFEKVFGIRLPYLTDLFSESAAKELLRLNQMEKKIPIVLQLQKLGVVGFEVCAEFSRYKGLYNGFAVSSDYTEVKYRLPIGSYEKWISEIEGNVFYSGQWFNPRYFAQVKDEVLRELAFKPAADDFNRRMEAEIRNSNSVSVHFRQGDYIKSGYALPPSYYRYATDEIRKSVDSPAWFVFSNSLDDVAQHLADYGFHPRDRIILVDGNAGAPIVNLLGQASAFGPNDCKDFYLMTQCKHMVLSNSSFSYGAALLNRSHEKIVIVPNRFMEVL